MKKYEKMVINDSFSSSSASVSTNCRQKSHMRREGSANVFEPNRLPVGKQEGIICRAWFGCSSRGKGRSNGIRKSGTGSLSRGELLGGTVGVPAPTLGPVPPADPGQTESLPKATPRGAALGTISPFPGAKSPHYAL